MTSTNRLTSLGIYGFWLAVLAVLYFGFNEFFKPVPQRITSHGDLVLTRARDGHFYADGAVNGLTLRFLVDTGASLVVVSQQQARSAGLNSGVPTVFKTANGTLNGYTASGAVIEVGPLSVSQMRVGVGLVGQSDQTALLGQNFLSKFDVSISKDQMVLRKR